MNVYILAFCYNIKHRIHRIKVLLHLTETQVLLSLDCLKKLYHFAQLNLDISYYHLSAVGLLTKDFFQMVCIHLG